MMSFRNDRAKFSYTKPFSSTAGSQILVTKIPLKSQFSYRDFFAAVVPVLRENKNLTERRECSCLTFPTKKVSHPLKSPPSLRIPRLKVEFLPLSVMVHTRIWWRRSIQFSHTAMSAVSNQGMVEANSDHAFRNEGTQTKTD